MGIHSPRSGTGVRVYFIGIVFRERAVCPRAFVVFVDPEMRGFIIVIRQHIGTAGYGGMAVISCFRIQNGFPEQIGSIHRFPGARILVSDPDAVAVTVAHVIRVARIYLAAGRNFPDRIRHAQQQAGFKEERQELMIQRNGQLMVVNYPDARQVRQFACYVFLISQDVLCPVNFSADLFDLRAHHQQQGKGIIPCGNGGAVAVVQIVIQHKEIGFVAFLVLSCFHIFNDRLINDIYPLVLIPVDQVVSVDQRAYVDVSCIVAKHLSKEIPFCNGRMTDPKLIGIFCFRRHPCRGFFCRGRPGSRRDRKAQHQRHQKGQVLLDFHFRYLLSLPARHCCCLLVTVSDMVDNYLNAESRLVFIDEGNGSA